MWKPLLAVLLACAASALNTTKSEVTFRRFHDVEPQVATRWNSSHSFIVSIADAKLAHICTGTLIDPRVVVTSAFCLLEAGVELKKPGKLRLLTNDPKFAPIRPKAIIVHPDYKFDVWSPTVEDGIAIIFSYQPLSKSSRKSTAAQPIPLGKAHVDSDIESITIFNGQEVITQYKSIEAKGSCKNSLKAFCVERVGQLDPPYCRFGDPIVNKKNGKLVGICTLAILDQGQILRASFYQEWIEEFISKQRQELWNNAFKVLKLLKLFTA